MERPESELLDLEPSKQLDKDTLLLSFIERLKFDNQFYEFVMKNWIQDPHPETEEPNISLLDIDYPDLIRR